MITEINKTTNSFDLKKMCILTFQCGKRQSDPKGNKLFIQKENELFGQGNNLDF